MAVSKSDLLNILYIARCLGSVDDVFAQSELQTIKKLTSAFHLTIEDLEALKDKVSAKEAVNQLESVEAKEILVDVLFVLAASDGFFDNKEKVFTKNVMNLIDIDPEQYPIFWENSEEFENIFGDIDNHIEKIKEKAESSAD